MRTAVLQYSDFPQSGDWNAVFFSVHAHFLQSDDFVRLLISGSVHDAVGAFADAAELFVHGERVVVVVVVVGCCCCCSSRIFLSVLLISLKQRCVCTSRAHFFCSSHQSSS